MDQAAAKALAEDLVIDITTTGRTSGEPRKLEIWIHEVEGRYYITGSPGTRGWYANLLKNPSLTVHLKQSLTADLKAHATPVTAPADKRPVFVAAKRISANETEEKLDEWLAKSPLVEIVFE